ncbi:hypothetical protein ODJ79_31800 [Actinoplanes sp. KI2]|uniref:hypothetical protein n=1 Tax=Actinoplanes sp. KI2 TaxID=2983315 RepID=UPI0021D5765B|nr:hypothetical protein [Actinoplanes sp. KI2]MCU7728321.1 hypothetical protein [Actinoplanes sp. KI2]
MTSKIPTVVLAALLAPVLPATAGCAATGRNKPAGTPSRAAGTGTPSSKAPAPGPTFADLTTGSKTSVVKLYSYDAKAHSAVVEPIIFLDGPTFCKAFKIKASDPQCGRDWQDAESHTKVTLPVRDKPKLTQWDNHRNGDCTGTITSGAICPATESEFATWLKANPAGFAVITTADGTVTKIAQMYTP